MNHRRLTIASATTPGGQTAEVPSHRRRGFAPLWVYFFGLFALAAAQRLLLPPDDRSVAANVATFLVGAVVVVAAITALERRR